ncbi:hypothetical protein IFM89_038406 [Coptis chinensis]|uniref:BHLH domain-containing protein n=1 Tax=Coptis chinensis TaxID=261450 RepID=A0A835LPX9_9MAGN|nr:hypothetical protein IFM89_038406 [Coptis chinensis]
MSMIADDQISDLVRKLQELVPEIRRRGSRRTSTSKILKEACSYINSLHREVDGLSERLSEILASMDINSAEAEYIRSLLMQP